MNENDSEEPTLDPAPRDAGSADGPSDADISALLAGARVTEPVPDDVVARLDATLAELTAERRSAAEPGTADTDRPAVVPLRRRLPAPRRLLAAAAAVVVVGGIGVGISKVLSNNDTLSSASTAAADNGTAAAGVERPAPQSSSGGGGVAGDVTRLDASTPRFRTATFAQDAAGYLDVVQSKSLALPEAGGTTPLEGNVLEPTTQARTPLTDSTFGTKSRSESGSAGAADAHGTLDSRNNLVAGAENGALGQLVKACPGPAAPGGTVTGIELDGKPAVLVVHPPVDGLSLVEAWSCDGSAVLASASIAS